jgi:Tat protein secretion system quality control protein TatD with DNase activity
MKVTGNLAEFSSGTSADVQVEFRDDQNKILHSFTVNVDDIDRFVDTSAIIKFGAYPKLRDELGELVPQMHELLAEAIKTDAQREAEAAAKGTQNT